jgi:hypothetical protein
MRVEAVEDRGDERVRPHRGELVTAARSAEPGWVTPGHRWAELPRPHHDISAVAEHRMNLAVQRKHG